MQIAASNTARAAKSPQRQMTRLADGYLITQLLYVAAKLGIADLLSDKPQTSAALARDKPGAIRMDLHMLLLFDGGRERTAAEFATLVEKAGFKRTRVVRTPSPVGLGIIEAVR
jgi:hypothetical protein